MWPSSSSQSTLLLLLLLERTHWCSGFAVERRIQANVRTVQPPRISSSLLASTNDDSHGSSSDDAQQLELLLDQVKLRDAVRYLQSHPDTPLNKERWDKIFTAIEERTLNTEDGVESSPADFPLESAGRQEMTDMYNILKKQNHLTLFGAVQPPEIVPAGGSHKVSPQTLEEILSLPMKALTPKATNSIWIAGAAAASLLGVTSLITGINLNLLFGLSLIAATLDRTFLNGAVFETYIKLFSPGVQKKILRHEANHLLTAYLLGCPVEGIVLSAWAALQDRRFGSRQVTAGTSFFDPELSQQINSGGTGLTRASIDRYSIIVMAGIAAEANEFGFADGGAGDEMALVAFLSQLNGNRGATTVWDNAAIKNQARWGALQAALMLREYKPAYEALVDALERGGRLGDCIYAIEKAAREHNLKPLKQPVGFLTEGSDGRSHWTKELPKTKETEHETAAVAKKGDEMDPEESLETLRRYRTAVEERLREIDEELQNLTET